MPQPEKGREFLFLHQDRDHTRKHASTRDHGKDFTETKCEKKGDFFDQMRIALKQMFHNTWVCEVQSFTTPEAAQ